MQNEWFEKIELYLNNELTEEESRLFEEQLKSDEQLQQQVNLYKTIENEMRQKAGGNKEEDKLKKTLSDLNKKYFDRGNTATGVIPINQKRKWLYVAAAAMLVIVAGAYWYLFAGSKDNEILYTQYAMHQPLSIQRSDRDTIKILQEAIASYNSKKFNEALAGLTSYLQTDSSDAELVLAKNICLMETGNHERAIEGFTRLALENEIFKSQATWYKALVYLKQNNKADCRKILESIPPDADTYPKAKELFKKL